MNEPCEQCVDCDLWDMEENCGCPCHRQGDDNESSWAHEDGAFKS